MPPPNTPEDAEETLAAATAIENAVRSDNADLSFLVTESQTRALGLPLGFRGAFSSRRRQSKIVDFHTLNYLDDIDDNLLCPICAAPFVDPVTTPCDHTFCSSCLMRSCKESSTCPVDRESINLSKCPPASRLIKNQLDSLRVQCPHRSKGCLELVRREAIVFHVQQQCPYTPVTCPDPACAKKVARQHTDKACQHKEAACQYCSKLVELTDMENHLKQDCPENMTSCEKCGEEAVLSELKGHEEKCPEAEVSCKYAKFGCSYTSKRMLVPQHHHTCVYQTLSVIGRQVLDQKEEIQALKHQEQLHQEKITDLERVIKALAKYPPARIVGEMTDLFHMSSAGDIPPDGPIFTAYNSLERQLEELSKNVTDLETRQTVMVLNQVMPIKDQITEIRSTLGILKMHVAWLMNSRREELERSRLANRTATGSGRGRGSSDSDGEASASGRRLSDGSDAPRL
jgi:Zinc finger, C3HC4 type (RING finger)/TRAF-type zinc finger